MGRIRLKRQLVWIILIAFWLILSSWIEKRWSKDSLTDPYLSQTLGKAIATYIHQTLTDPYFTPLEQLSNYLIHQPQIDNLTVDILTKWAPDSEFPTCFVWNTDGSLIQLDHALSWDVTEALNRELRSTPSGRRGRNLLYISLFQAAGENWWLGFLPVPLTSPLPTQYAGVVFSIDKYLRYDVLRFLKGMVSRSRFPLVPFEGAEHKEEKGGVFSFRILKEDGTVYYQQGVTFDPKNLIYSESRNQESPVIVALQKNWDLEIYYHPIAEEKRKQSYIGKELVLQLLGVILISISWGINGMFKKNKPIRLDN